MPLTWAPPGFREPGAWCYGVQVYQSIPLPLGGEAPATLTVMRAQVWKALGERPAWDAARAAFDGAPGRDPDTRVATLARWVRDRFLYTPDPLGLELLTDPTTHAQAILARGVTFGDCDDAAALVATLGKAGGIPAKLVAVAYRADAPLSHVYATLRTPRGWAIVDPTLPPQGPAPTPRRRLEVRV